MCIDDSSIFASKPFTFIVEGKPLYVHAALIAECSEPLNRMINGQLKEAQQGFAVLDDVDEGTFLRFIRWTYSRDYPAQEHSLVIGSEPEAGESTTKNAAAEQGLVLDWGFAKAKKKKGKKTEPAVKGYLRESFIGTSKYADASHGTQNGIPAARANRGPEEDYTSVFLGHARMYVFADKYDIMSLKATALQKLHHQLAIHTLYLERVIEISSLLSYVYTNTTARSDDIRSMLAHYVGVEMANLYKDGDIKEIMLEEPDMLNDFLKMFSLKVN